MSKSPLLTHYVSEIDQLLQNFDKEHPALSRSQRKECDKFRRIAKLRDDANTSEKSLNPLWKEF